MSNFPIIATALAMVLGLSVTRLLLGFVTVFRIRHKAAADWVPLAWAGVLLVIELQFWWAINQLPLVRPTFSFPEFIFFVLLTLMLFLSAALLLPSRSEDEQRDLRSYYENDGRYALLFLSAFLALAFIANLVFFKTPFASLASLLDLPMIALPVAAFFARSRLVYAGLTLLYVPLTLLDTFIALTA